MRSRPEHEHTQDMPENKPFSPSGSTPQQSSSPLQPSEPPQEATSSITYRAGRFSSDGRRVVLETRNATPGELVDQRNKVSLEQDQVASLADAISKLYQQQKHPTSHALRSSKASTRANEITNGKGKLPILRPKTWPKESSDMHTSPFLRDDLSSQGTESRINIKLGIAKLKDHLQQYQQMLNSANEAYKLASSVFENYPPLIARCNLYLAVGHHRIGEWELAKACIQDAEACVGAYKEGELWEAWRDLILEGKTEAKIITVAGSDASAADSEGEISSRTVMNGDRVADAPSAEDRSMHDESIYSYLENLPNSPSTGWAPAISNPEENAVTYQCQSSRLDVSGSRNAEQALDNGKMHDNRHRAP